MIFKIVLNNEIHRVNVTLKTFEELESLIQRRFANNIPMQYHMEYLDADNDLVRIGNEEDFQILLEDFATLKSAKLFIKSHDQGPVRLSQESPVQEDSPIVLNSEDEQDENAPLVKTTLECDAPEEVSGEDKNFVNLADLPEVVLAQKPEPTQEAPSGPEKAEKPSKGPEMDDGTQAIADYHKFAKGWLDRFNQLLMNQNIFTVMEKAKFRCKNLMSHVPCGKGNKKNLMVIFKKAKQSVKNIVKTEENIRALRKKNKKNFESMKEKLAAVEKDCPEIQEKLVELKGIYETLIAEIMVFKPIPVPRRKGWKENKGRRWQRRGRGEGSRSPGRHARRGWKGFFWKNMGPLKGKLSDEEWKAEAAAFKEKYKAMVMNGEKPNLSIQENSGSDAEQKPWKFKNVPFDQFLPGWIKRFETLLANENIFVLLRQAKFRCKNLMRQMPHGKGYRRQTHQLLKKGFWATKSFFHEHRNLAKMIKNKKLDREALGQKYAEIITNNFEISKACAEIHDTYKYILKEIKEIPFDYSSESGTSNSSSDSDSDNHGWKKRHWKRKHWKQKKGHKFWGAMKEFFGKGDKSEMKEAWKAKKEDWKAQKRAWKQCKKNWGQDKKEWKKHCKGKGNWEKKKAWWKNKVESKFQDQIEQTISQAVPQIAIQVAQILNANQAHIPTDLPKMERIKRAKASGLPIHYGYVCDGCHVGPIIGDCYKCSVCLDFDFCQQCEATKPHPYPFIKIRSPEKRPLAVFTVIPDEKDKPKPKFIKQCKQKFQQWVKNMKEDLKAQKKAKCPKKAKNAENLKNSAREPQIADCSGLTPAQKPDLAIGTPNPEMEAPKQPKSPKQPKKPVSKDDEAQLAQAKATNALMNVFQLQEENRMMVFDFVKSFNPPVELEVLTNRFIDTMLPKINQGN